MKTFIQWSVAKTKQKEKKRRVKTSDEPSYQGNTALRNADYEGETDRGYKEIIANDFLFVPEA